MNILCKYEDKIKVRFFLFFFLFLFFFVCFLFVCLFVFCFVLFFVFVFCFVFVLFCSFFCLFVCLFFNFLFAFAVLESTCFVCNTMGNGPVEGAMTFIFNHGGGPVKLDSMWQHRLTRPLHVQHTYYRIIFKQNPFNIISRGVQGCTSTDFRLK